MFFTNTKNDATIRYQRLEILNSLTIDELIVLTETDKEAAALCEIHDIWQNRLDYFDNLCCARPQIYGTLKISDLVRGYYYHAAAIMKNSETQGDNIDYNNLADDVLLNFYKGTLFNCYSSIESLVAVYTSEDSKILETGKTRSDMLLFLAGKAENHQTPGFLLSYNIYYYLAVTMNDQGYFRIAMQKLTMAENLFSQSSTAIMCTTFGQGLEADTFKKAYANLQSKIPPPEFSLYLQLYRKTQIEPENKGRSLC